MSEAYRYYIHTLTTELKALGLSRGWVDPPLYRLLWRIGVRIHPPVYQSSRSYAVMCGLLFVILSPISSLLMSVALAYLDSSPTPPPSVLRLLFSALISGVLFGTFMTAVRSYLLSRHPHPPLPPYTPPT